MQSDNFKELLDTGLLQIILDTSPDGFTYTDKTGYITYINKTYSKLTGLSEELILGNNVHQLMEQGYPVSRMMLEVFETRQPKSELIQYSMDTERQIMVSIAPVYDEARNFCGVVGSFRDMTELMDLRRKMETTYLEFDRELKARSEANKVLRHRIYEMLHLMEDYDLVGKSPQMRRLAELAYRICNVNSTVLITGESGVGKDVFCQMIHKFGGADRAYIKISCGAIPENLLESELFGYEPGSFTGASRSGKPGIFELAGDGTVFLDEIGEMPLQLQVKLLTVLQDRKFFRIGGTRALPMNARVIAATNRNLKQEVEQGRFRQDLYYRLNVIPVQIPPLRERKEDILPLADHMLEVLNQKNGTRKLLNAELRGVLTAYHWPGNIRELNNIIERMYVLSNGDLLGVEVLPDELAALLPREGSVLLRKEDTLRDAMARVEAELIRQSLRDDRSLQEIAEGLGIDLSTLVRKIRKYHLPHRYKRGTSGP